jgi:hypothetical protein
MNHFNKVALVISALALAACSKNADKAVEAISGMAPATSK